MRPESVTKPAAALDMRQPCSTCPLEYKWLESNLRARSGGYECCRMHCWSCQSERKFSNNLSCVVIPSIHRQDAEAESA